MNLQKKIFNGFLMLFWVFPFLLTAQVSTTDIQLPPGGRVVFMGDGFIERMIDHSYFETLLHYNFPDNRLIVRNLGWSGDELGFKLRSPQYGEINKYLNDIKPDLIIACFGKNESFAEEAGLPEFRENLKAFLESVQAVKTRDSKVPQVILVSPIAQEDLPRIKIDTDKRNEWIKKYAREMELFAQANNLAFVDLFSPTKEIYQQLDQQLTINGMHLSNQGYSMVSEMMASSLNLTFTDRAKGEALRKTVIQKNKEFFYYWRPVNAEYIVGTRNKPFGVKTFPPEIRKIEKIVGEFDQKIWEQK